MKKVGLLAGLSIVIIIMGLIVWWIIPSSIVSIKHSEVSRIEIFNGNNGEEVILTDQGAIKHIIENLNEVSLKKEKISLGYGGYSFRITIYKNNGKVYKEFTINSSDTIRRDPFFYKDRSNSIDYNFIKQLFDNRVK